MTDRDNLEIENCLNISNLTEFTFTFFFIDFIIANDK